MAWNHEQRQRLAYEKGVLERYFPRLKWANPAGNTYVWGEFRSNSGKQYGVRLDVPNDYPVSHPSAYIAYPHPLRGNGRSLHEVSGQMHTLRPDSNGYVQVCHNNGERWTQATTLYQVLMKVRFWLEAYEGHLATGKPIDHYLAHM